MRQDHRASNRRPKIIVAGDALRYARKIGEKGVRIEDIVLDVIIRVAVYSIRA